VAFIVILSDAYFRFKVPGPFRFYMHTEFCFVLNIDQFFFLVDFFFFILQSSSLRWAELPHWQWIWLWVRVWFSTLVHGQTSYVYCCTVTAKEKKIRKSLKGEGINHNVLWCRNPCSTIQAPLSVQRSEVWSKARY
jgi:hypothetical protein